MADRSRRSRQTSVTPPTPRPGQGAVWSSITLIPNPVPPVSRDAIATTVRFLQTNTRLPILLQPLPGKHESNTLLRWAEVAAANGVPLNLGDLGHVLVGPFDTSDAQSLQEAIGGGLLLGELRASTLLRSSNAGPALAGQIASLVESYGLAALIIWLDFADQALESSENVDSTDALDSLEAIADQVKIPLLAHARTGLPRKSARALVDRGFAGLITGGAEVFGPGVAHSSLTGLTNWGIPTIAAVRMLRSIGVPVISSGSIQHGLDAAKAIAIGADLVSLTIPGNPSTDDARGLEEMLRRFEAELRTAMYLSGASRLADLKHTPFVATGETREWLEAAEVLWRSDPAYS